MGLLVLCDKALRHNYDRMGFDDGTTADLLLVDHLKGGLQPRLVAASQNLTHKLKTEYFALRDNLDLGASFDARGDGFWEHIKADVLQAELSLVRARNLALCSQFDRA